MEKYLKLFYVGAGEGSFILIPVTNIAWVNTDQIASINILWKQMNKAGTGPIRLTLGFIPGLQQSSAISDAKKLIKNEIIELLSSGEEIMESSVISTTQKFFL